jgi:dihydrofolate reductase
VRKVIEYTLISADGVFEDPVRQHFMEYRDEAYLRDGLGILHASDALLLGRATYEAQSRAWPGRVGAHPWAARLNAMPKYVFSSTLEQAGWNNSTIIRGDVVSEVSKLKQQDGGSLLIFGHGQLGETLMREHLVDELDLSIHPILSGQGKLFFREGLSATLTQVAVKSFSKGIVKLTYELH